MDASNRDIPRSRKAMARFALGALGVVYGDIGTSPLYTMKETFGPQGILASTDKVLGILSLVFWSLILVVSVKYAGFIMRADNKGEGGIMALMALAQRSVRQRPLAMSVVAVLGSFGASTSRPSTAESTFIACLITPSP